MPAVLDAKPKAKPQSGIVVPHTLNWWRRALAWVVSSFIRVVAATLRWQWEFHPALLANQNRPVIFCTWHNRIALSPKIGRAHV